MMKSGPVAFTASLFAVGIAFLALSSGLEPGARTVPLSVATPLCVLLGLQLLRDARTVWATSRGHAPGATPESRAPAPAAGASASAGAEAEALGWLLVLGGLFLAVGMLAGSAVFVTAYLRRRGAERWPVALAGGTLAGLLVWLVVTRMLAAPLSGGLLARLGAG